MSYRAEIERMLRTMPSDWKAQWAGARSQLRALDYDAAAQPDVDDAMQALYLTAGGNESGDPIKGPIPVPAAVRDEAMRALRMAHKHNYGAWNFIGIARAIQLAVVPSIGVKSVDRMRAFFTRHQKDATAPHFGDNQKPSRGYLAHLVWGGDPAKQWVNTMRKRNPKPEADEPFSSGLSHEKPPSRKGRYEGEALTRQIKVDTGKFRYIPMPSEVAAKMRAEGREPGEKLKVKVVETQTVTFWVWDGRKWVKPDEWRSSTIAPYEQTEYERRLSTRHKREAPPPSPVRPPRQPVLKRPKRDKDLEKIARMFRDEG